MQSIHLITGSGMTFIINNSIERIIVILIKMHFKKQYKYPDELFVQIFIYAGSLSKNGT